MPRRVNKNFLHLRKARKLGYRGAVLEGSSRSGKTFSSIDMIVYICMNVEKKCTINIIRETYNSFKTTLYEDFNRRLPDFGIASPFEGVQERSQFYINGSKINLIGADKPNKFMGAGCDYVFFNEAIHIKQSIFDQAEMRCRKFWWMDYNPEYVKHWIYDKVIPREDVSHLRTTFRDNPFISDNERKKILSYEPTPENLRQGTADEFMWKVYGLGERSNREGAVFTHWRSGDYPVNPEYELLGIDWGFNNPSAVSLNGYKDGVLYSKQILYKTGLVTSDIIKAIESFKHLPVYCDSAEPDRITELKREGFKAFEASKDVMAGITRLKETTWIVDSKSEDLVNELHEYVWKKDRSGDETDVVVKEHDHLIDSIRYAHYTHHKKPKRNKFGVGKVKRMM